MWGWVKGFFSSDVVKEGMKLVDNAAFTKQEKAKHNKNLIKIASDYMKTKFNLSSRTRRWLAWMFGGSYCITYLITFIFTIFDEKIGKRLEHLMVSIDLKTIVVMIATFYFGSHLINGAIQNYKNKETEK